MAYNGKGFAICGLCAKFFQNRYCKNAGLNIFDIRSPIFVGAVFVMKIVASSPHFCNTKPLAVIATTTFQNEICGGIKSVTLPQDGQTCLYPLPCGI